MSRPDRNDDISSTDSLYTPLTLSITSQNIQYGSTEVVRNEVHELSTEVSNEVHRVYTEGPFPAEYELSIKGPFPFEIFKIISSYLRTLDDQLSTYIGFQRYDTSTLLDFHKTVAELGFLDTEFLILMPHSVKEWLLSSVRRPVVQNPFFNIQSRPSYLAAAETTTINIVNDDQQLLSEDETAPQELYFVHLISRTKQFLSSRNYIFSRTNIIRTALFATFFVSAAISLYYFITKFDLKRKNVFGGEWTLHTLISAHIEGAGDWFPGDPAVPTFQSNSFYSTCERFLSMVVGCYNFPSCSPPSGETASLPIWSHSKLSDADPNLFNSVLGNCIRGGKTSNPLSIFYEFLSQVFNLCDNDPEDIFTEIENQSGEIGLAVTNSLISLCQTIHHSPKICEHNLTQIIYANATKFNSNAANWSTCAGYYLDLGGVSSILLTLDCHSQMTPIYYTHIWKPAIIAGAAFLLALTAMIIARKMKMSCVKEAAVVPPENKDIQRTAHLLVRFGLGRERKNEKIEIEINENERAHQHDQISSAI